MWTGDRQLEYLTEDCMQYPRVALNKCILLTTIGPYLESYPGKVATPVSYSQPWDLRGNSNILQYHIQNHVCIVSERIHGIKQKTEQNVIIYNDIKISTRVWRYQRGNQNPYIEEEQTTQWPKVKVHKDKQRSTKHTHKAKDRVTRTPLKTGGEPEG